MTAKPPKKRAFAASPLADFVNSAMAEAFKRQGFAATDVITHWEDIVGPELARRSEPVRLTWPRREDEESVGTLTIRVEGPYAIELQHSTGQIMERVNRYFGWRCVGRITIRQGPVTPRHKPPAAPREPEAGAVEEVAQKIGPFEDEALGESLARLGALVKGRVTRS
ncbi:MAG TPA: DciA family protein [Xanthobacteraceae bacterium]|nr:DciA family protein [Xanthobacteraceae bacterium]